MKLRLAGGDGTVLDAIAFRAVGTPLGEGLLAARGRALHVAGRLRQDDWNGRIRVQLEIEDAAPLMVARLLGRAPGWSLIRVFGLQNRVLAGKPRPFRQRPSSIG